MKSIGKLMCAVWRSFIRGRLAAELPAGANDPWSASPMLPQSLGVPTLPTSWPCSSASRSWEKPNGRALSLVEEPDAARLLVYGIRLQHFSSALKTVLYWFSQGECE